MRHAFSLVELSIVLVILGLLTGGILTGQALIHAAELRSLMADRDRYLAAVHTFRDKYFALPGDMTNATAFWGIAAGTTGSDSTCGGVGDAVKTCNGNGNRMIDTSTSAPNISESLRFWQHLANAGLIEGTYTGIPAGGTPSNIPGQNVPRTKYKESYFYPRYIGVLASNIIYFGLDYGNYLSISSSVNPPPLFPEDAWNIDTKSDDGNPATGTTIGTKGDNTYHCTTAYFNVINTGEYNITENSTPSCGLYFVRAF